MKSNSTKPKTDEFDRFLSEISVAQIDSNFENNLKEQVISLSQFLGSKNNQLSNSNKNRVTRLKYLSWLWRHPSVLIISVLALVFFVGGLIIANQTDQRSEAELEIIKKIKANTTQSLSSVEPPTLYSEIKLEETTSNYLCEEENQGKIIKQVQTTNHGPAIGTCDLVDLEAQHKTLTYVSYTYRSDDEFKWRSEVYDGEELLSYSIKPDYREERYIHYAGGEYAVELTTLDSDIAVPYDMCMEIEEMQEESFDYEGIELLEYTDIDGTEYYIMRDTFEDQSCSIDASLDSVTGTAREDLEKNRENTVTQIQDSWFRKDNLQLYKNEVYLGEVAPENLIYEIFYEKEILAASLIDQIFSADQDTPLKEVTYTAAENNEPSYASDLNTGRIDTVIEQGISLINPQDYSLNNVTSRYVIGDLPTQEERLSFDYQSDRSYYPEGARGDELYDIYLQTVEQQQIDPVLTAVPFFDESIMQLSFTKNGFYTEEEAQDGNTYLIIKEDDAVAPSFEMSVYKADFDVLSAFEQYFEAEFVEEEIIQLSIGEEVVDAQRLRAEPTFESGGEVFEHNRYLFFTYGDTSFFIEFYSDDIDRELSFEAVGQDIDSLQRFFESQKIRINQQSFTDAGL